jgi:hypothetical protein
VQVRSVQDNAPYLYQNKNLANTPTPQ